MDAACTNEQPSTSTASKQVKINDSANKSATINTATATAAREHAAQVATRTPTLAQIGKQTSHNFRLSQISDSGAESGDEQTRLIRSPSARPHKFIIIPNTPPTPTGTAAGSNSKESTPPFRQTISTSSLSALAAAVQKTPASGQQPLQRARSVARQLSASGATFNTTSPLPAAVPVQSPPTLATTVNQPLLAPQAALLHSTPAKLLTRSTPQSQSDVVHQPSNKTTNTKAATAAATTTTMAALLNNNSAGVTFTIEDCESDSCGGYDSSGSAVGLGAGGYGVHRAGHEATAAISSIKSAPKLTPGFAIAGTQTPLSSSTTTLVTATTAPSATAGPPFYRSVLSPSETSPYLQSFSRGRSERSSMRSVVSAYIPGSQDPLSDALAQYEIMEQQQQQQQHYLRPSHSGKDLSASSSFIFRDQVANQIYSDVTSVRSLASIGIGSTDGRRLVIRRVPHTPHELFNMVHPPTPPLPGVDDDDNDSFLDASDDAANLKPRQQHWANKMQFVLACIGYSVGLGNVWRFPYMCYKSGGGVFLVPYCIILFICSIPLLFMELSIGQYTGRGPIGALGQLCPLFKGAGLASVVVSFLMSTYYSVIIGYSIYYFFTSFRPDMPWIDCNNRWNTPDCWVPQRTKDVFAPNTSRTPSEEFFE
ncbi:sodium- and chloride-dependent GABA transporter ine isoform X3 [Ceratitis capitata]|nr:sodium- and chloride-dependent GABA transporter ine isoform X3 [Ceratitis capitata]